MNIPEPSLDERLHVAAVTQAAHEAVTAAGGFLPFEQFMELVLYAPRLGYYAVGTHKLGRGGDFVTAPELSPVLAYGLATQYAEVAARLSADALPVGSSPSILEIGAGSGRLAFDVLSKLDELNALPAEYQILEISPDLKARQRALLEQLPPHLWERVRFLSTLPSTPWMGVVLANEVVDAMPVEWFEFNGHAWQEVGVALAGGELIWAHRQASAEQRRFLDAKQPQPILGERRERNARLEYWVSAVFATLARGVGLFIDYGGGESEVWHGARHSGTLTSFYRHHQNVDLFRYAGICDVTAWVDFTELRHAARAGHVNLAGFTTQAAFLMHTDFEAHFQAPSTHPNAQDLMSKAQAAKRLMHPNDMGERFKVMALSKNLDAPLRGFKNDLSHLL